MADGPLVVTVTVIVLTGHITAEIRCSEGYIPVDVVQRGPDYYIITFQPKVPGQYQTCL